MPRFDVIPLLDPTLLDMRLARRFGKSLDCAMTVAEPTAAQNKLLLHVARRRYGNLIKSVQQADYVVFQAEGTMSGTNFMHGHRLLLLPYLAKTVWNKPVLSMNQTLFAAEDQFRPVLQRVFSQLNLVAVREQASLQFARQMGLTNSVLIPDAAFLTQPTTEMPTNNPGGGRNCFTVTGSAIIEQIDRVEYIRTIDLIAKRFRLKPVLLCSTAADRSLVELAGAQRRGWLHIPGETDHSTVATLIQRSRFLIGGRYHMAVLAAATRTPFVLLPSNTFKNEGLIRLLDYPLAVRKFEDREQILKDVQRILCSHSDFIGRLERGMQIVREFLSLGERFLRRMVASSDPRRATAADLMAEDPELRRLAPQYEDDPPCHPEWELYYRQVNQDPNRPVGPDQSSRAA